MAFTEKRKIKRQTEPNISPSPPVHQHSNFTTATATAIHTQVPSNLLLLLSIFDKSKHEISRDWHAERGEQRPKITDHTELTSVFILIQYCCTKAALRSPFHLVSAAIHFVLAREKLYTSCCYFVLFRNGAADKVAGSYLRAFQASGELSERSLAITRLVLEHNASHYTAWWFRRRCIYTIDI